MKILLGGLVLVLVATSADLSACDADSDCGPGATCIKREKRARGVCYGGAPSHGEAAPAPESEFFDPLSMPTERPEGACFVTEECPAGMACVKAGVWGICTAL
jgi:hypothetical protein